MQLGGARRELLFEYMAPPAGVFQESSGFGNLINSNSSSEVNVSTIS